MRVIKTDTVELFEGIMPLHSEHELHNLTQNIIHDCKIGFEHIDKRLKILEKSMKEIKAMKS